MTFQKPTDYQALTLFLATAVILESIAAWSSADAFPSMKGKIFWGWFATVVLAGVIHRVCDEYDAELRRKGLIAFGLLNLALTFNCFNHFDFGRQLDAAHAYVQETNVQEDKNLAREKERTALAVQISEANARTLAEKRKTMNVIPNGKVGKFVDQMNSALIAVPQTVPSPAASPAADAQEVAQTPAQVRAEMMPKLLQGLLLSFGLSVILATALFIYKNWDRDGDGTPDWLQRAAKNLGEERFAQIYPKEYGLYSPVLFPGK